MALVAGFAWFVADAARSPPVAMPRADGIVALTGGADRVITGLRLLRDGAAPKLLLSGVGRGVELRDVAKVYGIDPTDLAPRIVIGHAAADTRGNAEETASWARAEGVRSLLVVTSGYHMRRATMEIARALPEVTLYPVPVRSPSSPSDPKLYASEFAKLLVVATGAEGGGGGGF